MPLQLRRRNGSVTPFRNSEYLPFYYFIPKSILKKCGAVAAYMANRNIVTVDAGVPVLSMHAPLEIVSKLDCYHTMLACKAIYLA